MRLSAAADAARSGSGDRGAEATLKYAVLAGPGDAGRTDAASMLSSGTLRGSPAVALHSNKTSVRAFMFMGIDRAPCTSLNESTRELQHPACSRKVKHLSSCCCNIPGKRLPLSAGQHGTSSDALAGDQLRHAGFDRLPKGRRRLLPACRRGGQ